jgi:hypothetical protein
MLHSIEFDVGGPLWGVGRYARTSWRRKST